MSTTTSRSFHPVFGILLIIMGAGVAGAALMGLLVGEAVRRPGEKLALGL